jgi:DNA-binding transcriptional ArsR family regulator
MQTAEELASLCKVFSAVTRVRIIKLLKGRALCVNALASRLDVTQGAVSQHLRILRDAGALTGERRGYFVHYRVNPRTLVRWKSMLDRLLEFEEAEKPQKKGVCPKGREGSCAKRRRHVRSRKN